MYELINLQIDWGQIIDMRNNTYPVVFFFFFFFGGGVVIRLMDMKKSHTQ